MWCMFISNGDLQLCATPSALETSTDSHTCGPAKSPPKLPISVRTLRLNVFCARYLMRLLALIGAADIHAGVGVGDGRRVFFWAVDWAKQSGPSDEMLGQERKVYHLRQSSNPVRRHAFALHVSAPTHRAGPDGPVGIEPRRTRRSYDQKMKLVPDNLLYRDWSAAAAVLGVIAIVAHHEQSSGRNSPRTECSPAMTNGGWGELARSPPACARR